MPLVTPSRYAYLAWSDPVNGPPTVVGTAPALFGDGSDATYVTLNPPADSMQRQSEQAAGVSLGAVSFPDGAVLTGITINARARQNNSSWWWNGVKVGAKLASQASGLDSWNFLILPANSGYGTDWLSLANTYTAGLATSPFRTDGTVRSNFVNLTTHSYNGAIQLYVKPEPGAGLMDPVHVSELGAQIGWEGVTTPSTLGVTSGHLGATTRPTFTWTNTGTGLSPNRIQVAVWSVAALANYPGGETAFNADMDAPFRSTTSLAMPSFTSGSGTTYSAAAWTKSPSGDGMVSVDGSSERRAGWEYLSGATSWTPSMDLPATGNLRIYLRTGSDYSGSIATRLQIAGRAQYNFTMAVVPAAAPTSWAYAWNLATQGVDVTLTLPAQSMVDRSGSKLILEHAALDTHPDDWAPVPLGTRESVHAAQTITLTDTLAIPGRAMRYRARIELYTTAGLTVNGTFNGPAPSNKNQVTGRYDRFILRDPFDPTAWLALPITGDLESTNEERLTMQAVMGDAYPSIQSDAISSDTYPMTALFRNEGDVQRLENLRARRVPLVLFGDMGGWWAWVRFGPNFQKRVLRSSRRYAGATRLTQVSFQLVACKPPYGLPTEDWLAYGTAKWSETSPGVWAPITDTARFSYLNFGEGQGL